MNENHRIPLKRLPLYIAAALGSSVLPLAAQATVLSAEASYTIDGTTVNLGPQVSATSVDILEFTGNGSVDIGIHTYGTYPPGNFGNRVSGDVNGTGSYDVSGVFSIDLDYTGPIFTFNIVPGEVSASGDVNFFGGDFVEASIEFLIEVDGQQAFSSTALARVDSLGNVMTSFTGVNLYSCSTNPAGFAGCTIAGGAYNLDLGGEGPHNIVYTLSANASGQILNTGYNCGGGDIGGGSGEAALAFIDDGSGGDGGFYNGPCGSVSRTGDPLGVAEPASLGLAGLGLAALARVRRKRQAA